MIKIATRNNQFNKGDIFMMSTNPVVGHEQGDYRPCVVISDTLQKVSPHMLQIAPITSKEKGYPLHVELVTQQNKVNGVVLTDHTRTVDIMARGESFKIIDKATDACINECKKIIDSF
jgi:mRNA interferase MazF